MGSYMGGGISIREAPNYLVNYSHPIMILRVSLSCISPFPPQAISHPFPFLVNHIRVAYIITCICTTNDHSTYLMVQNKVSA